MKGKKFVGVLLSGMLCFSGFAFAGCGDNAGGGAT